MDSQNWRVKHDPREEPKSEGSERSKSRKSWKPMPGYSGPQQSWTSLPEYPNTQPLYRGGRNPTRPAWMDPIRRPTSDVAITVDAKAHQAIDQGRRLYVGNLQYSAKLHDLQSLFADVQDSIEDISMSIDPMTGRNPSYCFIDFVSRDAAQRVIREYNGQMFMDRRLKVRPGVKSGTSTQSRRFHLQAEPRKDDSNSSLLQMEMRASPMAFNRWRRLNDQFDPSDYNNAVIQEQRRLYVGGLPRFPNQVEANIQIRDLFAGFNVEVVSKMVSPHTSVQAEPGNHYYCFVDLATSEEATEAVKALNGVERWNWTVVVSPSTKKSGKLTERQRIYVSGLPYFSNARALQNEMKTLFEPFGEVKVVSKLFDERDDPNKSDGVTRNCYYCFVELADSKQADAAIEKWGPIIRVKGSNRKMGYDD